MENVYHDRYEVYNYLWLCDECVTSVKRGITQKKKKHGHHIRWRMVHPMYTYIAHITALTGLRLHCSGREGLFVNSRMQLAHRNTTKLNCTGAWKTVFRKGKKWQEMEMEEKGLIVNAYGGMCDCIINMYMFNVVALPLKSGAPVLDKNHLNTAAKRWGHAIELHIDKDLQQNLRKSRSKILKKWIKEHTETNNPEE